MDNLYSYIPVKGTTPASIFEIHFNERFVQLIRTAVCHVLLSFSEQHSRLVETYPSFAHFLYRVGIYRLEVFFGIWSVIESTSLIHYDATFIENMMGYKRMRCQNVTIDSLNLSHTLAGLVERFTLKSSHQVPSQSRVNPLRGVDRLYILLVRIVSLYIRAKMDSILRDSERTRERDTTSPTSRTTTLRVCFEKFALQWYPYLHSLSELTTLFMYVRYALGASRYSSLSMALRGLVLHRLTEADILRQAQQRTLPSCAKVLLVLSALCFRLLDWYIHRRSIETTPAPRMRIRDVPSIPCEKLSSMVTRTSLPQEAKDLLVCPLCTRSIVNPALNAVSGYVFCYPCIRRYVEEEGKCPVTGCYTSPSHVRRLYETASET